MVFVCYFNTLHVGFAWQQACWPTRINSLPVTEPYPDAVTYPVMQQLHGGGQH